MTTKAIIAGAGIGGLATAIALGQAGMQVDVYEASNVLDEIGAGIQLSPNAMQILRAYGLAAAIENIAFEPGSAILKHYQTAKPYYSVPLKTESEQRFGAKYLHVHRADLQKILLDAAKAIGAQIHLNKSATVYTQDENTVRLEFSDGSSTEADLLIAADGIRSVIRKQMLKNENSEFTGNVAWRGVIDASKVPPDTILPDVSLWLGPGRHFVSYYVRKGQLINFVAVEERDTWSNESWSETGDMQELRAAFSDWHPSINTLLNACDECYLWGLFDHKPLDRWSEGRVVLIGDACHPMLPFMAQGAAMALEDSYELATCLTEQSQITDAFIQFERQRKPRTSKIQAAARDNARLFHGYTGSASLINRLKFSVAKLAPELARTKTDFIYRYDKTRKNT